MLGRAVPHCQYGRPLAHVLTSVRQAKERPEPSRDRGRPRLRGSRAPAGGPQKGTMTLSPRILIVEDNPDHRFLLQYQLHKIGIVDLVDAADGEQALDLVARGEPVDLIIMDLGLPRCHGWEATRRIRALPSPRRHIPIVAYTAYATAHMEQNARAAGCDAYLTKPLRDVRLLQQTLTHVFARGHTPNDAPLHQSQPYEY
jgi:two-component system cell cycle response regulator DivK